MICGGQTYISCRTRIAVQSFWVPAQSSLLFFFQTTFYSLGKFFILVSALIRKWNRHSHGVHELYMTHLILYQSCWEKFNLIFFLLHTHTFLCSLVFNICLFKNVFFSGLSLSVPFSLDFPLWLLSSWPLHSWILDPFETGSGPLSFLGRHLPGFQRRERQVRCL